jgi:putative hydrolase of the HAD superfamily
VTVRVVLFDAGNTLVEPDWAEVGRILGRHGLRRTGPEVRAMAARAWLLLDGALARHAGSTESAPVKHLLTGLLLDAVGFAGGPAREPVREELGRELPRLWRVPLPGVFETLRGLRADGYRLGVVSNSNGTIERGLGECGFGGLFETVLDSAVVGVEKPDPEIFRIALARLSARAEEAVHVGDLPSVDVAGARAAGLAAFLLDPFGVFPGCDAPRLSALGEVPEALRLLTGRANHGRMGGS